MLEELCGKACQAVKLPRKQIAYLWLAERGSLHLGEGWEDSHPSLQGTRYGGKAAIEFGSWPLSLATTQQPGTEVVCTDRHSMI